MRIISGDLKGRKLLSVRGMATRPTSDRVREALFNILGARTHNAKVLDLFAGTGALGIEALSRGGHNAVFVDHSTQALAVLRNNIHRCNLTANSRVIQWDIVKNLNCLNGFEPACNLVFLDPPYHRQWIAPTLDHLRASQCLCRQAVVVAEHEPGCTIKPTSSDWVLTDCRRYGQTALSIFSFQPSTR